MLISIICHFIVGSLGTGGESDGDYSDDDDEDQGSETNGSMTEDYTDLATSQDGHHGDGRDIAVMRQQMEGKRQLSDSILSVEQRSIPDPEVQFKILISDLNNKILITIEIAQRFHIVKANYQFFVNELYSVKAQFHCGPVHFSMLGYLSIDLND